MPQVYLKIYIDADGCAVKNEVYKVAARFELQVNVVANQEINIPYEGKIHMEVVAEGPDVADDWIAATQLSRLGAPLKRLAPGKTEKRDPKMTFYNSYTPATSGLLDA